MTKVNKSVTQYLSDRHIGSFLENQKVRFPSIKHEEQYNRLMGRVAEPVSRDEDSISFRIMAGMR